MKRVLSISLAVLSLFWLEGIAGAEVIDKMVAVVETHIITASDMRQEREILIRLGEKPVDDDKLLVQQLIDNYLIDAQIADFPGVDVADADIDGELQKSAAREGPPSPAVREAVRRRIRMRKYFELRFGQFIHASDEDVQKYYNDIFLPAAKDRGLNPVPPLSEVSDMIRKNVVEEGLNHEVTIWLEALRRRSNIEVFQ
jgi:hypothetical protein